MSVNRERRLVEYNIDEGKTIVVEVEDTVEGGFVPASRQDETITRAQQTFDEALETVKPAAEAILKQLRSLSDLPKEIQVEFGIKLSANAGAIVATAGIEANYIVRLTWTHDVSKSK